MADETNPMQTDRDTAASNGPERARRMPCGARVCLRCHGDCGPQRSSYILDGLDDMDSAGLPQK